MRPRTDRGHRCSCRMADSACWAALGEPSMWPRAVSGQPVYSLSPCCSAGILEMPRSNPTNAPEHLLHSRHWSSEVADAALPWETPGWTQDPTQVIQNRLKRGLGTLSGDSQLATGPCAHHLALCLSFPICQAVLHDPAPASPVVSYLDSLFVAPSAALAS